MDKLHDHGMAIIYSNELAERFMDEFNRLLNSGAVDHKTHFNVVIRVALENLADRVWVPKDASDYLNLKKF